MAKYIKPSGQNRILGSIEGNTFQRSGKVFSIRRRSHPVNKNTVKQSESKNRFAASTSRWRTLSDAEKNTWQTEAPNYPRINSLGVSYNLSSQQLQTSSNINTGASGIEPINSIDPPSPLPPVTFVSATINLSIPLAVIIYEPILIPANAFFRLEISRPQPTPLIAPSFTDYLVIKSLLAGQVQTDDIYSAIVERVGLLNNNIGDWLYTRATLFNAATGQGEVKAIQAVIING